MDKKLKSMVVLLAFVVGAAAMPGGLVGAGPARYRHSGQQQWRLGIRASTFKRLTFYEAVDKTASLGLGWIEAYPGQWLSKERPNEKLHHTMSPQLREEVKRKLDEAGVRLASYGTVELPRDEAKCRKVFDFADYFGAEAIISAPDGDALDLIEVLSDEYGILVGIHNHLKPTAYWHPDRVLAVCRYRSYYIGACADTGNWARSGIDPVEGLRKLKGRIVTVRLKDVNRFGRLAAQDVVLGTGQANIKKVLQELDRQNFGGVFLIEYECCWDESISQIQQCIEYFNTAAAELERAG